MDTRKKMQQISVYSVSCEGSEKTKESSRSTFWTIDKEMLLFKLQFFLLNGALGSTVPYISVLARNRVGLSATSMAAILTTQRFSFIFTKIFIGYLADYFQKLKLIIGILTVVQGIFFFLLLTIPKIEVQTIKPNNMVQIEFPNGKTNISFTYEKYHTQICSNKTLIVGNYERNHSESTMLGSFSRTCRLADEEIQELYQMIQLQSSKANSIEDIQVRNNANAKRSDGLDIVCCLEQQAFSLHKSNISVLPSTCCVYYNNTNDCFCVCCTNLTSSNDETKLMDRNDFKTYQFWFFALISTIASASVNALFTLADTACSESVQKTGADFGRQRLWSAIGWGIMSPVGGFLNDYTDDYFATCIVAGIMSLLSLWNLYKLKLVQPHFSKNILKDVGTVLKSKEFLAFEFGVLMHGISIGFIWFYLIWFIISIGGSRFLCGLAQAMQCIVGDIPFMFFSGWFIKKLGHFNVLTVALISYFVRFFAYSHIKNPWLILPMECLHGITYGLFMPAVASYAKMSAKPGTEATTQAILFTTHEGLGCGIGSVLAGLGFDHLGGHQTFFYASLFAGCCVIISIVFSLCIKMQNGNFKVTPAMCATTTSSTVPIT